MTGIEIVSGPHDIMPAEFDQRLAFAQAKAQSLARIVEAQKLYTLIQDRKHLHVEAWVTIAEGYGYQIDIEWTRPLPDGGYEARAVIRDAAGMAIGHAEAECGSQGDDRWENHPHFQQRSMAQTRAISKVARNRLAWVVVLAGYSPTPSEEMGTTPKADQTSHWCAPHGTNWFKRGKMRNYAHPIEGTDPVEWCNEPAVDKPVALAPADQPPALTVDHLRETVEAAMPWEEFEIKVLRRSWANFIRTKGASPTVAMSLLDNWQKAQPKAQEGQQETEDPPRPPSSPNAPQIAP